MLLAPKSGYYCSLHIMITQIVPIIDQKNGRILGVVPISKKIRK